MWAGLESKLRSSSKWRVMKCSEVKENENEREMCIRQTKASKNNMKCTYICEPACECENLQVDEEGGRGLQSERCWRCCFLLVNCVNKGVSSTVCVKLHECVCEWMCVCVHLCVCALIYCVHQVTLTHLKFDEAAPQCFFRIVPHKLWWDSPRNGIC